MQNTISLNGIDVNTLGLKLRDPRGVWDIVQYSRDAIAVPGRAGQLVPQASTIKIQPRTIDIIGTVVGTSRSDLLTKLDTLKALLMKPLTVIMAESPTRKYIARTLGMGLTIVGPVLLQTSQEVTISLICDDPFAYDVTPQVVGFTGATAIPLGNAPSRGIITITGAAVNPIITYKSSSGVTIEAMSFTRTLAGGDTLTIDLDNFLITKTVSAVTTNDINALTSGNFIQLSSLDGDFLTSSWPTLQVSAGTGSISYRRAYQ